MPLFDAHCHLDQLVDSDDAVRRAVDASVHRILSVSEGKASGEKVLDLKRRHPGTVLAGLGIHPMFSVSLSPEEEEDGLSFIERHLADAEVLGEVGLDFKWATTEEQKAHQAHLLERMLDLAKAFRKPINLHSRRAQRQTMEAAIAFRRSSSLPALMHWFTASKKLIRICAEEGLFISAGPSVLFDEHTQGVCLTIPDHLLLVETDSPVPYNGKPAEPAWARDVLEKLAALRGTPVATLENTVNENFDRYLNL